MKWTTRKKQHREINKSNAVWTSWKRHLFCLVKPSWKLQGRCTLNNKWSSLFAVSWTAKHVWKKVIFVRFIFGSIVLGTGFFDRETMAKIMSALPEFHNSIVISIYGSVKNKAHTNLIWRIRVQSDFIGESCVLY